MVLPKLICEVKEMEFSDQIKQLRKENNLSQTQFAEKLHGRDRRCPTGKTTAIYLT